MGNVFQGFPHLMAALSVEPRHVLHIGAHRGEEFPFYKQAGIRRVTFVEANPELARDLGEQFARLQDPDIEVEVLYAAAGTATERPLLTIMKRTNLSTLAQPQKHDDIVEQVRVDAVRVDEIQRWPRMLGVNILVVDVQGMELDVLASADLATLDLVIAECSTVPDPSMAVTYDELDDYMTDKGFTEVHKWHRDYQWINRWGRGTKARHASRLQGSVYDVAYVRDDEN